MVAWVLLIGIFNLALGYSVATVLVSPSPWSGWSKRFARRLKSRAAEFFAKRPPAESGPSGADELDTELLPEPPTAQPPVTIAAVEELPAQWLEQLANSGIVSKSYVEASAQIIRLEVGRYREQLLTAEGRARASLAKGDAGALQLVAEDLRFINQDWLEIQNAAAQMLAQRSGRLGQHEETAKAVEQALLDQAEHIRSIGTALEALDFTEEVDAAGQRLLGKMATLVDSAHVLRDRMLDLLATLLRAGEQIDSLSGNVQLDYLTGMHNRVGAEALFDSWCREDPDRSRVLSAAIIDVDRFARVNNRLGSRGGDRAIAALAHLMTGIIRKDRGFDRVARTGGQTFLVLLGDAGPHGALTAMERVRQTVEATTFDDQGTQFEMTISCGVVEVGCDQSVADFYPRAQQTLTFAKKSGRNRCAIDEGLGPSTLAPPQFAVQGRVVNLGEA